MGVKKRAFAGTKRRPTGRDTSGKFFGQRKKRSTKKGYCSRPWCRCSKVLWQRRVQKKEEKPRWVGSGPLRGRWKAAKMSRPTGDTRRWQEPWRRKKASRMSQKGGPKRFPRSGASRGPSGVEDWVSKSSGVKLNPPRWGQKKFQGIPSQRRGKMQKRARTRQ